MARKTFSEKLLEERGIAINPVLPFVETCAQITLRHRNEIATRLVCIVVCNWCAFDSISAGEAIEYFQKWGLWDKVTPKEKDFLLDPTDEKKLHETWKCECIWTLLWALNVVKDLGFPDSLCDLNQIGFDDYPAAGLKDPSGFINKDFQLRSVKEIMDTLDLYYRMDWACVESRINNEEMETLNSGVVYERHYALNWLTNYLDQEWDDITCDT